MANNKPTYRTMKEFTALYKKADAETKAMILGMLIKANADGMRPNTENGGGDDGRAA